MIAVSNKQLRKFFISFVVIGFPIVFAVNCDDDDDDDATAVVIMGEVDRGPISFKSLQRKLEIIFR